MNRGPKSLAAVRSGTFTISDIGNNYSNILPVSTSGDSPQHDSPTVIRSIGEVKCSTMSNIGSNLSNMILKPFAFYLDSRLTYVFVPLHNRDLSSESAGGCENFLHGVSPTLKIQLT